MEESFYTFFAGLLRREGDVTGTDRDKQTRDNEVDGWLWCDGCDVW